MYISHVAFKLSFTTWKYLNSQIQVQLATRHAPAPSNVQQSNGEAAGSNGRLCSNGRLPVLTVSNVPINPPTSLCLSHHLISLHPLSHSVSHFSLSHSLDALFIYNVTLSGHWTGLLICAISRSRCLKSHVYSSLIYAFYVLPWLRRFIFAL